MKWTAPHRHPNIRNVIDRYHLYERTLMILRTKMAGAGTPCTYWRNMSNTFYGTLDDTMTKCYCWESSDNADASTTETKSGPNRGHFLCRGTGILESYQKYGYHEIVFSTPSTFTSSSDKLGIGRDPDGEPDRFLLSDTVQSAYIETENYVLTNFKEVDFFLIKEKMDKDTNRLEYYYSTDDGGVWTRITIEDYTTNELGNKQAVGFTLPADTLQIKFRITFRKKTTGSPSPLLNSIRFRYRQDFKFSAIDPRYEVELPAFLASREQITTEITQGEYGWKTTRPTRWWTLPEANIKDLDIIMFLQGTFQDQKYEVQNIVEHTHGPDLQLLHRSFESVFLRDKYDIIRILDLLI